MTGEGGRTAANRRDRTESQRDRRDRKSTAAPRTAEGKIAKIAGIEPSVGRTRNRERHGHGRWGCWSSDGVDHKKQGARCKRKVQGFAHLKSFSALPCV